MLAYKNQTRGNVSDDHESLRCHWLYFTSVYLIFMLVSFTSGHRKENIYVKNTSFATLNMYILPFFFKNKRKIRSLESCLAYCRNLEKLTLVITIYVLF